MQEPNTKITMDRARFIYVGQGEDLIVTPARAAALKPFTVPAEAQSAPQPEDRMVRPKRKRIEP